MTTKFESLFPAFSTVFNEEFQLVSYLGDQEHHRLLASEVVMKMGNLSYLMAVETYEVHVERSKDEDPNESSTAYVIAADEILPSDFEDIKQKEFEALKPYLVEQDPVEE